MKQVILDTSFVLSCVRNKIDFFEKIQEMGLNSIVPEQTIKELKGLGEKLALKILEKYSKEFKIVKVRGKDADSAIVKLSEENPEIIVATLDRGLAKKVKNQKLLIRGKKKLEII